MVWFTRDSLMALLYTLRLLAQMLNIGPYQYQCIPNSYIFFTTIFPATLLYNHLTLSLSLSVYPTLKTPLPISLSLQKSTHSIPTIIYIHLPSYTCYPLSTNAKHCRSLWQEMWLLQSHVWPFYQTWCVQCIAKPLKHLDLYVIGQTALFRGV